LIIYIKEISVNLCNWTSVMNLFSDDKRTPKRILEWRSIVTRIRGRPRKRWIVDIQADIQIMGIRRWRMQFKERTDWKRPTEKAKTHNGL
jgi:hypothetical protein